MAAHSERVAMVRDAVLRTAPHHEALQAHPPYTLRAALTPVRPKCAHAREQIQTDGAHGEGCNRYGWRAWNWPGLRPCAGQIRVRHRDCRPAPPRDGADPGRTAGDRP